MKTYSVLKYVLLIVGIAILSGALYFFQKKLSFYKRAETAQGIVVEMQPSKSDRSVTYRPVVSFKTKYYGREIEFASSVSSSPPDYSIGDSVEVLYDPKDPKHADINGFMTLWLGPLILGIFGLVALLIGLSIIIKVNLRKKKIDYLQHNGKTVITKFDHVQLNTSYKVNDQSPFQIYSQWLDANTNKLYLFKSDDLWFDPTDFVGTEPIKVMIDPKNPSKYIMDISFLPERGN